MSGEREKNEKAPVVQSSDSGLQQSESNAPGRELIRKLKEMNKDPTRTRNEIYTVTWSKNVMRVVLIVYVLEIITIIFAWSYWILRQIFFWVVLLATGLLLCPKFLEPRKKWKEWRATYIWNMLVLVIPTIISAVMIWLIRYQIVDSLAEFLFYIHFFYLDDIGQLVFKIVILELMGISQVLIVLRLKGFFSKKIKRKAVGV